MNSIFEVYASRKYFPSIPSRNFMAFVTEFLQSTMTITQKKLLVVCQIIPTSIIYKNICIPASQIVTSASLINDAIPLVWNGVCLQQKQYGRQVKSSHGQFENNGASTPVLFSPWSDRTDYR